jgi:hypothetical protein
MKQVREVRSNLTSRTCDTIRVDYAICRSVEGSMTLTETSPLIVAYIEIWSSDDHDQTSVPSGAISSVMVPLGSCRSSCGSILSPGGTAGKKD